METDLPSHLLTYLLTHLPGCLAALAVASTLAILITLLLRRAVRRVFGAAAAYSTWLLVAVAMLAVLLPNWRSPGLTSAIHLSIDPSAAFRHALDGSFGSSLLATPARDWMSLVLLAWLAGVALVALYLLGLQRAFVNGLGTLSGSRRVYRAQRPAGCPALLGVLRPRVILPPDFESRYTRLERLLVFSHECTHLRRGDAVWNALVALVRCVLWFNPLVHLASRSFREDQELACDAAVVNGRPGSRRSYAAAMLKTQLADIALPVGCHWHAAHQLKERLRMLKQVGPGGRRRTCGRVLVAVASLVVGYAAWAAETSASEAPSIAVQFRLLIDDEISNPGPNQGHKIVVSAGRPFDVYDAVAGAKYESSCVVRPLKKDLLRINCRVRRNGQVFATPSVITRDGQRCVTEVAYRDAQGHLRGTRMEITPSIQK